jgi:hypothetical protein
LAKVKGFGEKKLDQEWIFFIISKVKAPLLVFFSIIYFTMDALGHEFKTYSFEILCELLKREQSKLM